MNDFVMIVIVCHVFLVLLRSNHVVIVECIGILNCFFFCFFWELGMISGDFWQTFVDLLENGWPKI